jgi:hypothetical protein
MIAMTPPLIMILILAIILLVGKAERLQTEVNDLGSARRR